MLGVFAAEHFSVSFPHEQSGTDELEGGTDGAGTGASVGLIPHSYL
jgi:hypothetical protein